MIVRAYRIAQVLSLDIVIGAVVLLRFFCYHFGVAPGWPVYVLLAGTVWVIYTVDHLKDAEEAPRSGRERYIFHLENKKRLIIAVILVMLLLFPLVFFIPIIIFLGGLILAALSFLYLLIQQRLARLGLKEFYVAWVYTLGILMTPMLLSGSFMWDVTLLFFMLTYINLMLFSQYERIEDQRDGFLSAATQLGEKRLQQIIVILLSTGIALSLLNINGISLYFIIGFIIYFSMLLFPQWYSVNQRYRTIGDGVFLLPILFEWL